MLKDSDPRKWECREHTRVKHILLEQYLRAWIPILGSRNQRIGYFDGFAGRGEYADGILGSPIIALRTADGLAEHYGQMTFFFLEKDEDNFRNLEAVLDREKPGMANLSKMSIETRNEEFGRFTDALFAYLEERKWSIIPSFFFIDPFGFSGVPFDTVRRILQAEKTEVFFNFMLRDVNRFLTLPDLAANFTVLFGDESWRSLVDSPNREHGLVELYRRRLHEDAGAKYSLHFRVCETSKSATLYYLIHANNHLLGHSIMKSVMFNQSVDGSFAYLGPKDLLARTQMKLFDVNSLDQLKAFLVNRFRGAELAFVEMMEAVCIPWNEEPPYIEKHYRRALKELEHDGQIGVRRLTSKTSAGLSGLDRVTFPG